MLFSSRMRFTASIRNVSRLIGHATCVKRPDLDKKNSQINLRSTRHIDHSMSDKPHQKYSPNNALELAPECDGNLKQQSALRGIPLRNRKLFWRAMRHNEITDTHLSFGRAMGEYAQKHHHQNTPQNATIHRSNSATGDKLKSRYINQLIILSIKGSKLEYQLFPKGFSQKN